MTSLKLLFSAVIISCLLFNFGNASLAAIAIDLGSQYMKIGLVKPGVPMEIVLNKESSRKTPTIVAIRNGERFFGSAAMSYSLRFPKETYAYFIDLLGKKFENPVVKDFQRKFPVYDLIKDENRGTVLFKNGEELYSPEELTAMLFAEAKANAELFAEQPIKDAVITVPPFLNQAERRAVARAAEIAELNLLQLMNDNTATGVNFGMFRRKQFNESANYVLVYDMGSSKTTTTILEYQLVKEKGSSEKNPQMTVLGVGYDRSLNGLEMTLRIRDILVEKFRKEVKTSKDCTLVPRAMAKLFKEAERLKTVLSANLDHFAQIENVMEEKDFKSKITREEYELRSPDLWDKIPGTIEKALKMAEMSMDQIETVLLMGGASRTPMVQERLKWFMGGREPAKFLNMDEAVALGAVYQAAHLSKGFKVKKFLIKEATLFPIQVDFERELQVGEVSRDGNPHKVVHRTLFGLKNPYPQKKVMTFSKHNEDFEFFVNYGNLNHLSGVQLKEFGELNISRVDLKGVAETVEKHKDDGTEYRGVKAHFRMDDSGILHLDGAEALVEKSPEQVMKEEEEAGASTLSKLGSKLAGYFSGSETDKEKATNEKKEEGKKEEKKEEKEEDGKQEGKDDSKDEKGDSEPSKEEKPSEDEKENKTEDATPKPPPKPSTIKVPLSVATENMDVPDISEDVLKSSKKRLEEFLRLEEAKRKREAVQNELESFVFETRDRLEQEEWRKLSTEEERETIGAKLQELQAWLDDEVDLNTSFDDFDSRLKAAKEVSKDLFYKHEEFRERDRAVDAVKQMLNHSSMFLAGMRNLTEDTQIFTETEMNALEKAINNTEKWWKEKTAEQAKLKDSDKPAITLNGVAEKINTLDREVKYLLNKAKFAKPLKEKAKEKAKKEEEAKAKQSEGKGDSEKADKETTSEKADKEPTTDSEIPEAGDQSEEANTESTSPETEAEEEEDSHDSTTPREDL